jgi:filamentous hemagglutinin family protein
MRGPVGEIMRLRSKLNFSGASLAVLSMALGISTGACAGVLPDGGHYVAGRGQIDKASRSLTVKQSSTTGIIDWKSFSVGQNNKVAIYNGAGATLNRVTSGNLSRIAGSLHATGSLYLVNAQGVIVSGTGRVMTGGDFVVSSGQAADSAFGDGEHPHFRNANAKIVNRGVIRSGGDAALIGSAVRNTGTITAASVRLRAETGDALAGGTIRATGSDTQKARIRVIAASGRTKVTGDLSATGQHHAGGEIETSGAHVSFSGNVDAGNGGRWLVDPENLTVTSSSAKTIENSLNDGTDVNLETTKSSTSGPGTKSSGPGDIIIDSAVTWTTTATLTLKAYHSVAFKKSVVAKDGGGLSLITDHGGKNGNLVFEGGSASFSQSSSALTINGAHYTLVSTLAQLGEDAAGNNSGDFALMKSIDAKSLGTLDASPIASDIMFEGVVEGLGNTVSNLTIKDNNDEYVGLVADNIGGVVRDINLTNVSITAHSTLSGDNIGGLVGYNGGVVYGSSVTGKISGGEDSTTGGLVGINWGTVTDSYSKAAVSEVAGGGSVGGLVGDNEELISDSYATGKVSGGSEDIVGGLTGSNENQNGIPVSIENSYATGDVSGSNSTIGGLGGLIGLSQGGKIEYAYATGKVTGKNSYVGGVIGVDDQDGVFHDVYWDTTTSKITSSHGAGNVTNDSGMAGKSTAALQAHLPSGFSSATWAQSSSVNGGLPYLTALAWTY